ncbi:hypothetical protein D9758_014818 [Tetrapyrgos nigripes]|uniref:Zn(2)-C6 fungal-type domain-containing protein n=1 Tax=Tetrapyrgos nigripes TaxID=182062 RepID=A0A8H5C2T1_9AGAR|nr:hypothetical protein D9758_014818 [Tetrapyrgos nigripes]
MSDDRFAEKKRRSQHACDECRRRKIRCDGEAMPNNICSPCLTLSIRCVHSKPQQQKRGPRNMPNTNTVSSSSSLKTLVESILKQTPTEFVVPEDKDVSEQYIVKLATHIQSLEKELEKAQQSAKSVSTNMSSPQLSLLSSVPDGVAASPEPAECPSPSLDSDIFRLEVVSKVLSQISMGIEVEGEKPLYYFGESSNLMLLLMALKHIDEVSPTSREWHSIFLKVKRAQFWKEPQFEVVQPSPGGQLPQYTFPPKDQLYQLIDAHFTHFNVYCPLLHRPSFERLVYQGLHLRDNDFGALVLAVCSDGAIGLGQTQLNSECMKQIRIDQCALSDQTISLFQTQTICLCALNIMRLSPHSERASILVALALRRAQAIGVHRRQQNDLPTIESELWKRAFWILVFIDTMISTWNGRPRATSSQDYDLGPLVDCDDEYWETTDPGSQAFVQPSGSSSRISYWNSYCKLLELLGYAQRTIYVVRRSELVPDVSPVEYYQGSVAELDSALNNWLESVPEHIRWNPTYQNNTFLSQASILYSMYYWTQIQVHRRFIPLPGQPSDVLYPCLSICTNAARSCLRVIETCSKRVFICGIIFSYPLFNVALILAINLCRARHAKLNIDVKKELQDIGKCIELIRLSESRFPISGRFIDILNTVLIGFGYHPYDSNSTQHQPFTSDSNLDADSPPPSMENYCQTLQTEADGVSGSPFYNKHLDLPFRTQELSSGSHTAHRTSDVMRSSTSSEYGQTASSSSSISFSADTPQLYQDFGMYPDILNHGLGDFTPHLSVPAEPWAADSGTWDTFMANIDQMSYPFSPLAANSQYGI